MKQKIGILAAVPLSINCSSSLNRINIPDLAYRSDRGGISNSLAMGGNINERDSFQRKYTALMVACREGDLPLVQFLIEKGADVNAVTRDGHTALMYASFNRYPKIVKYLLEHGADPELKSDQGHTALSEIDDSHIEEIKAYLNKGK